MNKFVVVGLALVIAVEVLALATVEHRAVPWISGGVAAMVLIVGIRLVNKESHDESAEPAADGPAESMRRWIARTESVIRWADSSQAEWDRHLRPRLAREFMMATGQRQGRDPAAMAATGRMVFGDDLWQWVDPSNVSKANARRPAPGRDALYEILQRLERV